MSEVCDSLTELHSDRMSEVYDRDRMSEVYGSLTELHRDRLSEVYDLLMVVDRNG